MCAFSYQVNYKVFWGLSAVDITIQESEKTEKRIREKIKEAFNVPAEQDIRILQFYDSPNQYGDMDVTTLKEGHLLRVNER